MLVRRIQLLKINTEYMSGQPCPDTLPLMKLVMKQFTTWNYIYIVNLVSSFQTLLFFS